MKRLLVWLDRIMKKRKELKRWQRVVTVLAAVITFATTYALILPAITVERDNTEEVAGMYLEQRDTREAMWEENALEPVDVGIADETDAETDAEIPDHADWQENLAGSSEDDGEETAPFVKTLKADGYDYTVTLTYDETSGIPEEADLTVSEIPQDSKEYQNYLAETKKTMGLSEEETLPSFAARFFDIKIMVGNQEFTPESGVSVEIRYAEPLAENPDTEVSAVHFADETAEAEVIEANTSEVQYDGTSTVEFTAESFSVYGIIYTVDFHWEVDGKMYEYSVHGGETISLKELLPILNIIKDDKSTDLDEVQVFINEIESVRFSDEYLARAARIDEDTTVGALKETLGLEPEYSEDLTDEQIAELDAKELQAVDWVLVSLKAFESDEKLTVSMKNGDVFTILVTDAQDLNGINGRTLSIVFRSGNNYSVTLNSAGNGIRSKSTTIKGSDGTQITNIYNTTETMLYCDTSDTAWVFRFDSITGGYYIENNGRYLVFTDSGLGIVTDANQKQPVFITKNQTVTEESVTDENDNITYTYSYDEWDGTYLISNMAPRIVDDEETGHQSAPSGLQYLLFANNAFSLTGDSSLAVKAKFALPEDPTSTSHKASMISATSIQSGQRLVIYQRVLQKDDSYRTYAIDGNGNMVEVFENSDSVYWVEDEPSITWVIEESSTGYYTLRNEKTGAYLTPKDAPGESGSQSVHVQADFDDGDSKHLNISLPGSAGGQYTSTISCWDYDANVTYGLAVNGGTDSNVTSTYTPATLEVPELTESQAFYFAACDPIIYDQLTTVDTVDSKSMGIKITMYDFYDTSYTSEYNRLKYMTDIMGNSSWAQGSYNPGFLSRTLDDSGYPVVVRKNNQNLPANQQRSLSELFEYGTSSNTTKTTVVNDVNHLFLQSVYDESGFFKYSCFENFAQLNYNSPNEDGSTDFIVYEQVGVPWKEFNSSGQYSNSWEGRHDYYMRGNFMPFDELTTANGHRTVLKDEDLNDLPDTDARNGEPLYYIKNVNQGNYYFGMIMEGSFTQNPGGLSDRGDPMVYSFNGDDDMWVYLDGVLVLDIGGVHDAFRGSINFRTGKVEVVGPKVTQGTGPTTQVVDTTWIKEQFYQAGKLPDGSAWPTRNGVKLTSDPRIDAFFTNDGVENGKLKGTFKDYSTHDFKMFYMERGAGASNLELMFNLTIAPEAGFRVKKELPSTIHEGLVQTQYADAPFYYKAYIRDKTKDESHYHLYIPNENANQPPYTASEPYYETIVQKDDGSLETQKTDIVWKDRDNGIFVVKPGQTAFFPVREKGVEWYVVEVPAPGYESMLDYFDVTNTDPANYDPPYTEANLVDKAGTVTKSRSVSERGVVVFNNYPDESLVNELKITKRLKGSMFKDPTTTSGFVEATENNSPYFEYKVFLESTEGEMVPYSLGPYYQKDKEGNYIYYEKGVRKHPETGTFEVAVPGDDTEEFSYKYTYQTRDSSKTMGWFGPIQHRDGTTTYEGYRVADGAGYIEYTYEPKITEYTSINGSLGDIRDGDTVIIKGLMVGTTFVVDERTDRSNMIKGLPDEDTDNKYLFEGTEVTGAFTGETDDEDLQERIEASGTLYTNDPQNADNVAYSQKAGKGVIIPDKDAHVLVKNKGDVPFSLKLRKNWLDDYDLTALDNDTKIVFTLKRYKINNKNGSFTLKAYVTGQPNYDPIYLILDEDGNVIRTVAFSSMEPIDDGSTETEHREKVLNLPIGGPYYVAYGTGTTVDNTPYGYDVTNSPVVYGDGEDTFDSIWVSPITQEEGEPMPEPAGTAEPDEATVESIFIKHTGSLVIQKKMTGDANMYGDFRAKYVITGNGLGTPIEIETPSVNGWDGNGVDPWLNGQWTSDRIEDLSPGRYTITEQILTDGPGIPEHKPVKRVVTVLKDGEATALFEGEYKSSKIPVTIYSGRPGGTISHTYKSVTGFEPGSTINISLRADYHGNSNTYTYETSSGVRGSFYGGTSPHPSINNLTLPASGELIIWLYHPTNNNYVATVLDDKFEESRGASSTQRLMMKSRSLTKGDPNDQEELPAVDVGTEEAPVRNTITPPACDPDTQYVTHDDGWSLEVALSNKANVEGETKNHVVSIPVKVVRIIDDEEVTEVVDVFLPDSFIVDLENNNWTAELDALTLASLNRPDLPIPALEGSDEDGNLYYYYIDAVREEKVPQGTSVTFDKDDDKTLYVSENNKDTPLSVTNKLVTAVGLLQIKKVVTINDENPTTAAGMALTNGSYEFLITGVTGTNTAGEEHTVKVTFSDGKAVSYKIDQNEEVEVTGTDNTWTVPIPGLPVGSYTIRETSSGNLMLKTVTGGNNDGDVSAKTVTVTLTEGDIAGAEAQVIFTNNMDTVNARIRKVWQDNNNSEENRPSELGAQLSNGTRVTLDDDNEWSAIVTDLPKYDCTTGEEIRYTWTEDTIGQGYILLSTTEEDEEDAVSGIITQNSTLVNTPNTHYNPPTSFTGTKIWNDDGTNRPGSITVILYKGEGAAKTEVERKTIEGSADSNTWSYSFTNIPIFDEQGKAIIYSIGEELPAGYTESYFTSLGEVTATCYDRDPSNDSIFVNEPNNSFTISTGVNLGFVVIKHGNIFRVWTPRKATDSELLEIKQKVLHESLDDSEFSQIEYATVEDGTLINAYGVPMSIPMKNNNQNHVNFTMNGENVEVTFTGKQWSQVAWGQLAYTYTPGSANLINTQKLTGFEFYKKWLDMLSKESDWDQDIEVTVERNKENGTKDAGFSLVYSLPKAAITDGAEFLSASDSTNGTTNDPKLKAHVTTENGIKKYRFTLEGLAYYGDSDGKYTYFVKETNPQLEGYLAPTYANTSAPTGAEAAFEDGTIINRHEGAIELPSTGGRGTRLFTILGMMLIAGAGLLLFGRRRTI